MIFADHEYVTTDADLIADIRMRDPFGRRYTVTELEPEPPKVKAPKAKTKESSAQEGTS